MFRKHEWTRMFNDILRARCIFLLTFASNNLIYGSHCVSRKRSVRLDVRENYSNEERNQEGSSEEGRKEGRPGEKEEVTGPLALASFQNCSPRSERPPVLAAFSHFC
jgi:hypothetical protein